MWWPIETAPRDGTRVILGAPGCASEECRYLSREGQEGWFSVSSHSSGYNQWTAFPPTHWQLMPEAPSEGSQYVESD